MLVHPWDAALDDAEWREWLGRNDFGQLIASGRGRDVPVVVPTHFRYDGATTVRLHLARPNPVWPAIEENPLVLLTVVGDWTFVPSTWGAAPGTPEELGIATSYYATVQLTCRATVEDGDEAKVAILQEQLDHHQPEGGYAPLDAADDHYARRLPQIRGLVLQVESVRAKFKYGGNKEVEHRLAIAGRLAARDAPGDAAARWNLLRRSGLQDNEPATAWRSVVLHCADPVRMARFWSAALGMPPVPEDAPHVANGTLPAGESVELADGRRPSVWLTPANDLVPAPGRLHLDVGADVDRLVALGATVLRTEPDWTVLADPEGNEFCAVRE